MERMPRPIPSPRAKRIYEDLCSLTVRDVLWIRDEMAKMLDGDSPAEGTGDREPREPLRPLDYGAIGLELPWQDFQDQ